MIDPLYDGREQSLVKHFILKKYLERFAHIVRTYWNTITYVDCFSGPWNARSDSLEDSSFAIALEELRKARQTLETRGKTLRIRCCFLEKDPSAFSQLKKYSDAIQDADILPINGAFENSISDILKFVKLGGQKSFPFFFIDPTGWTGFGMKTIAPLLSYRPGEVLINLMGHLHRFVDASNTRDSIENLFGSLDIISQIQGLKGLDRQDAVVEAYAENVRITGGFKHTGIAMILHPEKDKTHYHLVYATRNAKGLDVFKGAEKRGMTVQGEARSSAALKRREEKTGIQDLFGMTSPPASVYADELRARYTGKAKTLVLKALKTQKRLFYDDAWGLALTQPWTWESDLKQWILEWRKSGLLEINGMKEKQRVPKYGGGNILQWK